MVPYEIDILLWYHTRAEDHPDLYRRPPIWPETIRRFVDEGLLWCSTEDERNHPTHPMAYQMLPRGNAYCDALQAVPLPRSTWVIDWPPSAGAVGQR